jgi:hypothetical protein
LRDISFHVKRSGRRKHLFWVTISWREQDLRQETSLFYKAPQAETDDSLFSGSLTADRASIHFSRKCSESFRITCDWRNDLWTRKTKWRVILGMIIFRWKDESVLIFILTGQTRKLTIRAKNAECKQEKHMMTLCELRCKKRCRKRPLEVRKKARREQCDWEEHLSEALILAVRNVSLTLSEEALLCAI